MFPDVTGQVPTCHNPSFLPLGATAQGELWPPEQSASILLYSEAHYLVSEQFSFMV
jgi:hypothetical protein